MSFLVMTNPKVLRLIILGCLVLIVSCVTGPRAERKSPLNILNGENYQTGSDGSTDRVVVPILTRKERLTTVAGSVYVQDNLTRIPMRFQTVVLKSKAKVIFETNSNEKGEYKFTGVLPNGSYTLGAESKEYSGKTAIEISTYENLGIDISLTRKK